MRYFVYKLPLAYNEKPEKGDNSVMDFENFTKGYSGHQHLNTICDPNIMTLAQAVLSETFCSQASIGIMRKTEKGDNSVMVYPKLIRFSTSGVQPLNQIS